MFYVVGRGARSGMPLELRWAGATWFRDGKATRAIGYASPREALESVGLREQAEIAGRAESATPAD